MKLTQEDKTILREMGHKDSDFEQIEEATRRTVYKCDGVRITCAEAIELLGRRDFLSGISRSAFHWSAERVTPDGKSIYFDSARLFKE
jgi:hypothetical protein